MIHTRTMLILKLRGEYVYIIHNPYANRWKSEKIWTQLRAELIKRGAEFEYVCSEFPGHAEELALIAAQKGYTPIVAAGGDGTIGEIINGIMRGWQINTPPTLGVIPLGTANDFVANLKLPSNPMDSINLIMNSDKRVSVDVCRANDRYFINNSAIGLEPLITIIQQNMTHFHGILRYLVAALNGIFRNPKWNASIQWDQGIYEGPVNLVTIGNGARTGGLFYMSPHADPSDGLLTAVVAYQPTIYGILKLLPQTMSVKGRFLQTPGIMEINSPWISIQLATPSPAHCDGELFADPTSTIHYSILPAAIRVIH